MPQDSLLTRLEATYIVKIFLNSNKHVWTRSKMTKLVFNELYIGNALVDSDHVESLLIDL